MIPKSQETTKHKALFCEMDMYFASSKAWDALKTTALQGQCLHMAEALLSSKFDAYKIKNNVANILSGFEMWPLWKKNIIMVHENKVFLKKFGPKKTEVVNFGYYSSILWGK